MFQLRSSMDRRAANRNVRPFLDYLSRTSMRGGLSVRRDARAYIYVVYIGNPRTRTNGLTFFTYCGKLARDRDINLLTLQRNRGDTPAHDRISREYFGAGPINCTERTASRDRLDPQAISPYLLPSFLLHTGHLGHRGTVASMYRLLASSASANVQLC